MLLLFVYFRGLSQKFSDIFELIKISVCRAQGILRDIFTRFRE